MTLEASNYRIIKIGWMGCFLSVIIYSLVAILIDRIIMWNGLKSFSVSIWVIFFIGLIISLLAGIMPFTLLGRKFLQRRKTIKELRKAAFIRLALADVPVILGIMMVAVTGSYELYIPFMLMSTICLIILKKEERIYLEVFNSFHKE